MGFFTDFLRKNIAGDINVGDYTNVGLRQRVPFIFTSDYLLSFSGGALPPDTDFRSIRFNDTRQLIGNSTVVSTTDVSTNLTSIQQTQALIKMAINPNSIKWSQTKRFSKTDVMDGSVFTHFLDSNQQNNDLLKLDFSGNTGNISLRGEGGPNSTNARNKLVIWHALYNLTRQPMMFKDPATHQWIPNRFYIKYSTVRFPAPVTFTGFFDTVMSFDENANEPMSGPYSFSFIVTESNPSLDDVLSILADST